MNNTPQEPWLFCEGTDEMRPFIGNRKGFELLKVEIDALLSSKEGVREIECETLGFAELRIQEALPPIEPLGLAGKVILWGFLGFIILIVLLAFVGLHHLIS